MLELNTTPPIAALQSLTQRLRDAGRAGDWNALARLDGELALLLRAVQVARIRGPLSEGLRTVLAQLQQCHEEQTQRCAQALSQLQGVMWRMSDGRSRWEAYAQSESWHEERVA